MSRHTAPLVFALTALAAVTARAHEGARIWLNIEGQQVTTYAGPSAQGAYARSRVFTTATADAGGDSWETDFPGYERVPGGTIPTSTEFDFAIPGPLLWYNPGAAGHLPKFQTVAARFGSAAPQVGVITEQYAVTVTAAGPVAGSLAYAQEGPAAHHHLTYTLLGDGVEAGGGPDGIYALPLTLTGDGVAATSEPFYLLLGKRATPDRLAAAAALARRTLLLPGDADADGLVGFADLQRLELGYGKPDAYPTDGDFNFDGLVDRRDFKILTDHYDQRLIGQAPAAASPSQAIPEPGTLLAPISLLLSLAVRRTRRR